MQIKENYLLKKFTTMGVGGPAKYFITVVKESALASAIAVAKKNRLPWNVVGEGSNLIVSDKGYRGVVIKIQLTQIKFKKNTVSVGAGLNLLKLINLLNTRGLAGMERMAGIPGTVGGAIYGCAGAYGQEIKDNLVSVRIFDGSRFQNLSRKECLFGYRTSIFKKHKSWIITEASFRLSSGATQSLKKISRETIKLRAKKYKPGLACPGSFFKNLLASHVKIPARLKKSVVYGKLPAGVLLEGVNAKNMRQGQIAVAAHHANLIYNRGRGQAEDVKKLSTRLKRLVKKRFGIIIDEEVQYLGFSK